MTASLLPFQGLCWRLFLIYSSPHALPSLCCWLSTDVTNTHKRTLKNTTPDCQKAKTVTTCPSKWTACVLKPTLWIRDWLSGDKIRSDVLIHSWSFHTGDPKLLLLSYQTWALLQLKTTKTHTYAYHFIFVLFHMYWWLYVRLCHVWSRPNLHTEDV